jgi:hypothetical protein
MSKYKYKLVEQEGDEETSSSNKENIIYDLVLTPLGSTVQDAVAALEKIDNYGTYISNIQNTGADKANAIISHFGPSQRFDKLGLEASFSKSDGTLESFKEIVNKTNQKKFVNLLDSIFNTLSKNKGKFYPKTTKTDIDNFIKTLSTKPNLLKWKIGKSGDTLVFPPAGNPTKKITEKIISIVMDNAGVDYNLENKESTNESKLKKLVKEEIKKLLK